MNQHRNSQKRYYEKNLIYFIIAKTFQNFPYFKEPIFCELFVEELKLCKELKKFKLYGFCVIYDHLNLMIHPSNEFNISKIMQSIKKETSRDANYIIGASHEGDIPECRLHGKQFSKRYNKDFTVPDLLNFRDQFIKKYGQNQTIIPKFKWQKSYYDHIIRNNKDFEYHHNYAVCNFQKHNLPSDWKYTSLNYESLIDGIDL